jgi:UDP-N-acetylmuramoylalanine--D-glutamate ligase
MFELKNKKVTVVGIGRSGAAACHLLSKEGARVTLTDLKTKAESSRFLEGLSELAILLRLGGHDPQDFVKADLIVLSPGVPTDIEPVLMAKVKGIPVVGEMELGFSRLTIPVLAITGTNGKSTTTTLLGEVCRAQGQKVFVGGNLGRPLCEAVLSPSGWEVAVVEVSSFQLETIRTFRPRVAALLNVSPDHQDRYRNFEEYKQAKLRIFEYQEANDHAVLNWDDPVTETLVEAGRLTSRVHLFGRVRRPEQGMMISGTDLVYKDHDTERTLCNLNEIRIKGAHNLENAMAASLIALVNSCDPSIVARVLKDFAGLEHRLEFVRETHGVRYYNDSKGTNIRAVLMSLQSFEEPIVLIAGGLDKGGDFSLLREMVQKKVRQMILIGEAKNKISKALDRCVPFAECHSMAEAVRVARQVSRDGDVVLLSPGCASFDMFRNFEERGNAFKEAVHCLA